MENYLIFVCAALMTFFILKANRLNGKCASKKAGFGLMLAMVGNVILASDIIYRETITAASSNRAMALAVILMIAGYYIYQINVNHVCSKKRHKAAQ